MAPEGENTGAGEAALFAIPNTGLTSRAAILPAMCGIGGAVSLSLSPLRNAQGTAELMNDLLRHRGPDGEATWVHDHGVAAFAHRRLAIIDLDSGDQPMTDGGGNWVTHNGEIYNYIELRGLLGKDRFHTSSDTEVILRAYRQWGEACLERLRGMFSFALWDEETQTLFAARDRFGIKPLYYTVVDGVLYFASEVKALLPFLPEVETDPDGLADYLTFQFPLAGKTLFKGVQELLPGHFLRVRNGTVETQRYWEIYFEPDFDHTAEEVDFLRYAHRTEVDPKPTLGSNSAGVESKIRAYRWRDPSHSRPH